MLIGWLLIIGGSALAGPQVFAPTPWQAGFFLGCLLVIAGALRLREGRM